MHENSRPHRQFLLFFGALYLVFFFPVLTFQQGFVKGDYELQFYPWMRLYAETLKTGALPLWTSLIHCGFPLFEEGQSAMLYPLNLILFGLFRFLFAYNVFFLLHYLLGGLFIYFFALRNKMSHAAATFVAVAFVFGSASAGGFYGVFTLRPLVWFPFLLYWIDEFAENPNALAFFMIALAQGLSWLAGYPQIALYGFLFAFFYYFLKEGKKAPILFCLCLGLSILLAFPQLWATYEFGIRSTRSLQDPKFALWGSVAPWSLSVLWMYPWSGVLRCNLYIGMLPILLLIGAPGRWDRIWSTLSLFGLAFALGIFNPLYWLLIKLPIMSLLRNPSKFLFFFNFFLILMAGQSLDRCFEAHQVKDNVFRKRLLKRMGVSTVSIVVVSFSAWAIVHFGDSILSFFGRWYTERFVIGKSFHRQPAQYYFESVETAISFLKKEISLRNPFFWVPMGLAGISGFFFSRIVYSKLPPKRWASMVLLFLVLDLFVYGKLRAGTSFVGNIDRFDRMNVSRPEFSPEYRWLDISNDPAHVLRANKNIVTGYPVIGAYSPLIEKRYYLLTKDYGMIDDSFGQTPFSGQHFEASLPLLSFLGVKYASVDKNVRLPGLTSLAAKDPSKNYFLNSKALPEFNLVSHSVFFEDENSELAYLRGDRFSPLIEMTTSDGDLAGLSRESGSFKINVRKKTPLHVDLDLESTRDSFLVWNQSYHRGWRASVDGQPVRVQRVDFCFQGIRVPQGSHRIEWVYRPQWFSKGFPIFFAAWGIVIAGLFVASLRRRMG